MALIVEDGTGLSSADSYAPISYANAWHEARGRTDWVDGDDDLKDAAMRRAADYLDKRFGRRFLGYRSNQNQALEWPRYDAFDRDQFPLSGVPQQLKRAQVEYALIAFRQGELAPAPALPVPSQGLTGTRSGDAAGTVEAFTKQIGPLSKSVKFRSSREAFDRAGGSSLVSVSHLPEYPEADLWVEELLRSATSRTLRRG